MKKTVTQPFHSILLVGWVKRKRNPTKTLLLLGFVPPPNLRLLVTGHWSLVTGHWSLVTGH